MNTTTLRTAGAIFSAGILLTSCVSSKKYHRSEAEVARLRMDSTSQAHKDSMLQQNLSVSEQKNTDLQKSVEISNATNSGLQKNLAYYSDYFGKQKTSSEQMKGELTTTLAAAGVTDQNITQTDAKIFINIAEKNLFKGNSAVLTAKGKTLVNNIGDYVKGHEGVDVSIADLETATGGTATMAMTPSGGSTTGNSNINAGDQPASSTSATRNSNTYRKMTIAANTAAVGNNATVMHHKTPRHTVAHHATAIAAGENRSITYSSGSKKSSMLSARAKRAIAWQRQNAVANALLANGLPKVKLVSQNQAMGTETGNGQKGVQVVLSPDMDAFYKNMSEAPGSQPVGKNP